MMRKTEETEYVSPARRMCPVCGKHQFQYPFEECPVCKWANDIVQEDYPDWKHCGNLMSLNQAKARFAAGLELYPDDDEKWWDAE